MAGQLMNEGEELALNLLFRNTGSSPTDVYLMLLTAAVNEDDDLGDLVSVEVTDGGYSREDIDFGAPSQNTSDETIILNDAAAITFGPWSSNQTAEITHAAIVTAVSGTAGATLAYFELVDGLGNPQPRQPLEGDELSIPINGLEFGLQ